jgi:tetratricopeptide (TPR) repeat protein
MTAVQDMALHRPKLSLPALAAFVALAFAPGAAQAQFGVGMSTTGAYLAANLAADRSDLGAAARFYRVVFDRNPGNVDLASRALILWLQDGEIERAAPMAEVVINVNSSFEPARLVLATKAVKDERYDLAIMHLGAIPDDSFSALTAGLLSAWIEAASGDVAASLVSLAGIRQSDLLAAYHGALIADLSGRSDEALTLIRAAYQLGGSQRLTEAYARILARTGNRSDAVALLDAFLDAVPDHPTLGPLRDDILAGAEIAPSVGSAQEGAGEVFYGLASSLAGSEDTTVAIVYLQFARYLAAGNDLASTLLGQLLQGEQRLAEAVVVLDSVPETSPFYPIAATLASAADASRGLSEPATARLEPIVAENPTDIAAVNLLARLYQSDERWEDTLVLLSNTIDAVEIFPAEDWVLFFRRGVAFERLGRWDEAEVEFRRALALSPDEPDVLNYLGYTWVDRGENLLEALDMIERAALQAPNSGAIIDSLGWAYYRLGDFEAAVATLEVAVTLATDHYVILDHLADAYWRVGRILEAGYKWRQALTEAPDEETAAGIREKIENGLPELDGPVPGGIFELN